MTLSGVRAASLWPEDFLAEYFLRRPFSSAGTASHLQSLAVWETLLSVLATPGVDAMAVRLGQRWSEGRSPAPAEAAALHRDGYTLVVRHAEQCHAGLHALADDFRREFLAPVDLHLYATPAEKHGFGWHYDAEDVFIIQTQGEKEYSLRKNTVNPWPLLDTMPADLRYERELMPVMQCLLRPGDWLYIPHGYWHRAVAKTDSISIAVGLLMPSGLDLLDALRPLLTSSLFWRRRLPVPREGAVPQAEYREIVETLANDLGTLLRDESFLAAWLERRREDCPPRELPAARLPVDGP